MCERVNVEVTEKGSVIANEVGEGSAWIVCLLRLLEESWG